MYGESVQLLVGKKNSRDLVNFNSDFSFRILSKKGDDGIHGIARKILFLTG